MAKRNRRPPQGNAGSKGRAGSRNGQASRKGTPAGKPNGRGPNRIQARQEKGAEGRRRAPKRPSIDVRAPIIEGRHAVEEALEASLPIKRAFIQKNYEEDGRLSELKAALERAGVTVDLVTRSALDEVSVRGAHQGIVIETAPFRYRDVEELIAPPGERSLILLLDHVVDEGNLGAIVRSADAVGADGVVIANARAASVGPGAFKTSAGACARMPIAQVSNLSNALGVLKDAGYWATASTEKTDDVVWDVKLAPRTVLVMGSEEKGIARLLLENCDLRASLPMEGAISSLNVAQAATAMAYEWLRQQQG